MKEETQNQDEVKKIVVDENLAKQVEQKVNATTVSNNEKQEARVNNMLKSMANANVGDILKKIQPLIDIFNKVAATVFPIVSLIYVKGVQIYRVLPLLIIKALIGLAMTFFGGTYAVSIAAIEAFTQTGYEKFMVNATYLYTEFEILWKKSREDDKVDEDGDGIYDVLQITTYQLFQRKVAFFFANCSDPQKMMDMVAGILTGLASIVAVLKLQFAKVIALGATIGEILRKTASIPLVPLFSQLLPQKYHQWICPGINLVCKIIAISIAWYIQRVISSVQSAIRGGLMFSRNILQHLNDKGYIKFKEEESYLDEIVGWSIAALGVYFQVRHGFSLPFPLNLLFFPLSILEDVLVWIVSNY